MDMTLRCGHEAIAARLQVPLVAVMRAHTAPASEEKRKKKEENIAKLETEKEAADERCAERKKQHDDMMEAI